MTLALQAAPKSGKPRSRFHEIASRIARRFEPAVARAFLESVARLERQIDQGDLESAVASGNIDAILAAVAGGGDLENILEAAKLARVIQQTAVATGTAGAEVVADVTGVDFQFNALDVNAALYARQQAAQLIVAVSEDVREAVRIVTSVGQVAGLTVTEQARAIREVIGLPPNWANAPLNFAQELREGRFRSSRRLSAADKAQIRSRISRGTVNEEFIARMQKKYADSLRNRRALTIAHSETMSSANFGQRLGWKQAVKAGVLPRTVKRVAIVTPDARLRPDHAAIPGMNPEGVGLEETYKTPWGPQVGPPWPADPVDCRCSEGLTFPGLSGVL